MSEETPLIHVVEDEEDIAEIVEYNLRLENFKVRVFYNGADALPAAQKDLPDLILLDLMLPGMDGLEICRQLKAAPSTERIPIVMVTAKGEESDIVKGLELGADDYIVKPFSPKVLVARVKSVLRRVRIKPQSEEDVLRVFDLHIHPGRHEVKVREQTVDLTHSEFQILHLLARKPGWVFTRNQMVDAIRGQGYAVTERTIDFQMVGLRRKLGEAGDYLETVRGVGYRFRDS